MNPPLGGGTSSVMLASFLPSSVWTCRETVRGNTATRCSRTDEGHTFTQSSSVMERWGNIRCIFCSYLLILKVLLLSTCFDGVNNTNGPPGEYFSSKHISISCVLPVLWCLGANVETDVPGFFTLTSSTTSFDYNTLLSAPGCIWRQVYCPWFPYLQNRITNNTRISIHLCVSVAWSTSLDVPM